jgi:hypothetical protein
MPRALLAYLPACQAREWTRLEIAAGIRACDSQPEFSAAILGQESFVTVDEFQDGFRASVTGIGDLSHRVVNNRATRRNRSVNSPICRMHRVISVAPLRTISKGRKGTTASVRGNVRGVRSVSSQIR